MFKPGSVVQGPLVDVYLSPPSNSVWWPKAPSFSWLENTTGSGYSLRFDEGGFFFTFVALGTEINGRSNGDIDHLLQTRSAAELFHADLPGLALLARDRFEYALQQACWASLAIFSVDVEACSVDFEATLELEDADSEAAGTAIGGAA
jgi:hypothetical protein